MILWEARLLWATCGGVRVGSVYVPNGREVGADHYAYKLRWLARLRAHLDAVCDPTADLAVCKSELTKTQADVTEKRSKAFVA